VGRDERGEGGEGREEKRVGEKVSVMKPR